MKIVNVVGGLGSQMMAYSLYLALKKVFQNERVYCDFSAYHLYGRLDHNGPELKKIFGIEEDVLPAVFRSIVHSNKIAPKIAREFFRATRVIKYIDASSNSYNYDDRVFSQSGNTIYRQCWTSWKYFTEVESEIRSVFKFKPFTDLRNINAQEKINNSNSIAVHIRRGDYLKSKALGGIVEIDYYVKAFSMISEILPKPKFFIFSDDPEWVHNTLLQTISASVEHINWNVGAFSYLDMQLMSLCRHHIIPNSSFSWWGAYLAKHEQQVVIAPTTWSDPSTGIELSDMNMPAWLTIKNWRS